MAHCQAFEGFEESEVLRLAACVERESSHPLAAAIVGAAAGRGLRLHFACESSVSIPGQVCWVAVDLNHICNNSLLETYTSISSRRVCERVCLPELEGTRRPAPDMLSAAGTASEDLLTPLFCHLQGIVATLDGRRAVIGTAKLLAGYGAELTAAQAPAVQRWQDQGERFGMISCSKVS